MVKIIMTWNSKASEWESQNIFLKYFLKGKTYDTYFVGDDGVVKRTLDHWGWLTRGGYPLIVFWKEKSGKIVAYPWTSVISISSDDENFGEAIEVPKEVLENSD